MTVKAQRDTSVGIAPADAGFIAGEAPDGIVTIDNVPGRAQIDVLLRNPPTWVRRTISNDDGTYRIVGLSIDRQYDVIGRDMGGVFGDVIVSRVVPYAPPRITTTALAFEVDMPANVQMGVAHGVGPYTWSAVGLPPGLELLPGGAFDGMASAAGSYLAEITVVDVHGESATRSYSITVT